MLSGLNYYEKQISDISPSFIVSEIEKRFNENELIKEGLSISPEAYKRLKKTFFFALK